MAEPKREIVTQFNLASDYGGLSGGQVQVYYGYEWGLTDEDGEQQEVWGFTLMVAGEKVVDISSDDLRNEIEFNIDDPAEGLLAGLAYSFAQGAVFNQGMVQGLKDSVIRNIKATDPKDQDALDAIANAHEGAINKKIDQINGGNDGGNPERDS